MYNISEWRILQTSRDTFYHYVIILCFTKYFTCFKENVVARYKGTLGASTSVLRSALGACVRDLFGITVTSYLVRYNGFLASPCIVGVPRSV